ncbi:hypothetical protein PFICI_12338 [Pestalotiopsis fici W106-1]|uniref:Transcription initiation factor TFIID subunit 12 domain-containing protein n=1 Tax=Pestalotiopsis fici (strain W106-1 / CGMCC3.15140) TaxID=1229662 RepID=W3WNM6_PESFW|nr:uncharacterized protein PFICI_12338 [Pestalotiopsis fici W106-1]ETS75394.1 hypothetical protein PFICI_12338 [Pestalotiopsis fici W106-1]
MNVQQGQGQPGAAQPPQPQPMRIPMYRPEQMRSLEILSETDKEKYERGLRGLWDTMEKNPPDSTAHKTAKAKISEFSRMVFSKVANMRRNQSQAAQSGQGQQNTQQANQAALAAQQRANMAQPVARPGNPNVAATPAAPGQPRPAPSAPIAGQVSQQILNMANALVINPPPDIAGDAEKANRYRQEFRARYIKALLMMDGQQKKMQSLSLMAKERTQKGQPLTPEESAKYTSETDAARKIFNDAKRFAESLKAQALRGQLDGAGAGVGAAPPAGPSAAQGPTGQPVRPQPNTASGNPIQAATASVREAIGAAKNASSSAGLQVTTPNTSGPTAQAPQAIAPPVQTPTAPVPPSQPPVKLEAGSQQHHPPPVNTALAAQTAAGSAAGTPTPHSARAQPAQAATPTTAGPPGGPARPLTHQGALALANKSTHSVPTLGQQGHAGPVSASTPGSAGIANTPQAVHSHAHPQQIGAQHPSGAVHVPKMPIPKVLPERAQQIPQPVATGGGVSAGRPTLGNGLGTAGGTMNQPVIQKNPVFTFEAEGEHILDKKKLNELVRQCCGGGPPGQDGNYLTPDVEESCQQVADNFLDNVINTSCRLAKERGSKVLEIRDIQLVLERVYNIRIPGYTSDELRTVRKPQPSNAWLSKISAVQAAKVTRGDN